MQFYYLLLTEYALELLDICVQAHINPWWDADFVQHFH